MPLENAFDSQEFEKLDFPYDRVESPLSSKPRLFRGENMYVTKGGTLSKRPGTIGLTNTTLTNARIDRLWLYETLDTPAKVYLVASVFDTTAGTWYIKYYRPSAPSPAWITIPGIRSINSSTAPHEAAVSRGLLYIKGFPSAASGEKLGTVIFDGSDSGPRTMPWGLLAPSDPAAITGRVTLLSGDISDVDTAITVSANFSPAVTAPFVANLEFEQVNVTSTGAGTNWTVTRGYNGTSAVAHSNKTPIIYKNWGASDHRVDVLLGWKYVYSLKSTTGQISSRSPLETNPDKMPSTSGPFFDLIPSLTLTGNSDTVNIPSIVVFRSLDGDGPPFYELETINNIGGSISYLDDSLESGSSGGTFKDPVPDPNLDTASPAPTLFSNEPPPAVAPPLVTGVDTPVATTPIVSFQNRFWYAIGHRVFYSAEEEVSFGNGEECFPGGDAGNFFDFPYHVTNLAATTNSLFVFTVQSVFIISGVNKNSFHADNLFEATGHPPSHPRAICRFKESVAFLSHDFRVGIINGLDNSLRFITDPLFTDLVDASGGGAEFEIAYWADLEKELLIVAAHRQGNTTQSRQWVYDLKRSQGGEDFWNVPWTIRATAMVSGRISETTAQRRLVFALFNHTTNETNLVRLDPTRRTGYDDFIGTPTGFAFNAETHLIKNPSGNHVNSLREPGMAATVLNRIIFDTLFFEGAPDPKVYYYKDDLWTDPIQPTAVEGPARRDLSNAFITTEVQVNDSGRRFAVKINRLTDKSLFEMLNLTLVFSPGSGA